MRSDNWFEEATRETWENFTLIFECSPLAKQLSTVHPVSHASSGHDALKEIAASHGWGNLDALRMRCSYQKVECTRYEMSMTIGQARASGHFEKNWSCHVYVPEGGLNSFWGWTFFRDNSVPDKTFFNLNLSETDMQVSDVLYARWEIQQWRLYRAWDDSGFPESVVWNPETGEILHASQALKEEYPHAKNFQDG